MAQPSVASYFNTRKKSVVDEILKNKQNVTKIRGITRSITSEKDCDKSPLKNVCSRDSLNKSISATFEHKLCNKNITRVRDEKKKIVKFIKKGLLSSKQIVCTKNNGSPFNTVERNKNTLDKCTSEKQIKSLLRKELNFDEVKTKLTRSTKLEELKASICRIHELEKTRKIQEEQNKLTNISQNVFKGTFLKKFDTIDLEISPVKSFRTPVKLCPPPPPDKYSIMSPKSTSPKCNLFSPSKDNSPGKTQAFNKYSSLSKTDALVMPFKYRNLIEIFKAIDSVCAMYFNRKECITFKKLQSAVQRITRRNFHESHLAQIKHLYVDAYYFCQSKIRNYGSVSKHDYFQLIITPKIDFSENQAVISKLDCFTPQLLTLRYQKFQRIMIEKVKEEHDKFLKSLNPPLFIAKDQIKRWHPEFDSDKCADIEQAFLPQPPDNEKFASAKDMLSTARNLFTNSKMMSVKFEESKNMSKANDKHRALENSSIKAHEIEYFSCTLLKTVPLSVLEKIRAKQAQKIQGVIIRRPSQDLEATKYCHLPEIARHLRNVFVTEKRSVLTLEVVIRKLGNSYNSCLTSKEIETYLILIATECPKWIQIHEIRKATYLKMQKEIDMVEIFKHLKKTASEKLQ